MGTGVDSGLDYWSGILKHWTGPLECAHAHFTKYVLIKDDPRAKNTCFVVHV